MIRTLPTPQLLRNVLAAALAVGMFLGAPDMLHSEPNEPLQNSARDELDLEFEMMEDPGLRVMPLQDAMHIAMARFHGRLIAARLRAPRPEEHERGVQLVHELKLLTRERDVLLIRLDAQTGAFLEVRGSGLTRARRSTREKE
ncbi:hypothetical protein RGQ15_10410 [Paracoccus sp. MBLB3053]|uniref:PepSY domain-containing protein n=1 Tax=Paracoccus aurantius TaxID=3073814 RepID=A0ABU2HSG9_9RHOB|nr:hypothetical protein [Paracoccus sp. MBLB3053]MDS9467977.1 hypothetical protein [Paracoccus sp. MBLB3053]